MRKRLLSIDGGGIRGIIAGEVLRQIESIVCTPTSNYSCLADYFDFVGGTSTGSIIAAGLAKGMMVDDILKIYQDYGKFIFQTYWFADPRRTKAKYNPANLEKKLKEEFGDLTLDSSELKTFLMITTKNIGTGLTWFFTNHPSNKFYPSNRGLYLRDLLRASSAAPTYFPPHSFEIDGEKNYFVDGGVSSYNNPSLQLFLEATQEDYGVNWDTGADNLQVISIGTGFSTPKIYHPSKVNNISFTQLSWIKYIIGALMEDANLQQNLLMRTLGTTGLNQDDEIDTLKIAANYYPELGQPNLDRSEARLFDYHRYTVSLTPKRLQPLLQESLSDEDISNVAEMDCIDCIDLLGRIGASVAKEQVHASDFKDAELAPVG